ncbi:S1 RNA-binding domain-containing protein [Tepidibacter hydrothermalis]|uniref:S1 RNA-binding domain-containing protein n=1 Tax=Tepidibacter hydrothermalis TaxID=3036126 RepID=A0ABY8EAF8_9FIRM|nr:S1 RNA-binding domain-containing protein [Tepidibacter hydrothermalis]WFD09890.1 S1 RNA-binding domain-containing protein [Tepidibacter hydrothermalis]
MCKKFEIGNIIEGTVTDVKPFGAFVAIDEKTKGLVHISQISHNFINDINEHISAGDKVKVKIISIDEESKKISLSIKQAKPFTPRPKDKPSYSSNSNSGSNYKSNSSSNYRNKDFSKNKFQAKPKKESSLDDKLKDWLKQSDDRQATLNKRSKRR